MYKKYLFFLILTCNISIYSAECAQENRSWILLHDRSLISLDKQIINQLNTLKSMDEDTGFTSNPQDPLIIPDARVTKSILNSIVLLLKALPNQNLFPTVHVREFENPKD